ncbi:MAG TPA: PqqD family protein [Gemmatimonadaceae bacterium]|nr:PqqD family protein [Gemmatimonadaceae bacterium]
MSIPQLPLTCHPLPHVIGTRFGDSTVLLDIENSQYYSLNEAGGIIWALLCDGVDFATIVERLRERYPDAGTLEEDARALVLALQQHRLARP